MDKDDDKLEEEFVVEVEVGVEDIAQDTEQDCSRFPAKEMQFKAAAHREKEAIRNAKRICGTGVWNAGSSDWFMSENPAARIRLLGSDSENEMPNRF